MKLLSVILAILILHAGIMPCSGMTGKCCDKETTQSCSFEEEQNSKPEKQEKDCGPNCLCYCCNAVFINTKIFSTSYQNQVFVNNSYELKSNYSFLFNPAIWHPPSC